MNTYAPDSKFARVLDQTLDLLLVFILLGAPLIFYTKGHDVFEFNKLTAVRDFSALAATLFLAKLLFVRPLELTRSATDRPLLAWLAVCFICTFHTVNQNLSMHGVYEDFEGITTLVNYALVLFLTQQHIRSERQIRLMIGAVIAAGTVAGFYGILQNVNIDFVPWNPATYSADRMFSTMGNPNFLAAYLVMSLPVCLVVFLDLPERLNTDKTFCTVLLILSLFGSAGLCVLFNVNYFDLDPKYYEVASTVAIFVSKKFWLSHILLAFPFIAAALLYRGWVKILFLLSMLFQVVAVLFTKSRGGFASLAVILALFIPYFIWDYRRGSEVMKRNRWWLLGGSIATFLLITLVPEVRETTLLMLGRVFALFSPKNFTLTPRLYIWRSALQMLRDHFWFGTGLDTFQIAFPQYRLALYWILEWNGTPEKAHNMVMQIAATMGMAGLMSFFWLLASFTWRVFKDLQEQADSSRRLLLIGGFTAVAAFFAQNLFSFTVVGYGITFWIFMALLPAMQRTWKAADMAEAAVPGAGGLGSASARPEAALFVWRMSVTLLSLMGLCCLLAGTYFHLKGDAMGLRWLGFLGGLALLAVIVASPRSGQAGNFRWALLAVVGAGYFTYAVFSTRIWVADSFYKQGQVGISVNNPGYAALMYQKASGRIENISAAQEQTLLVAATPTAEAQNITFAPGLNPDQELYWVKMGIAFEDAAAAAQSADDKMKYYRTALAIHQLTLEMNPINGYNYNNKGRVLKAMGEAFNRPDFNRAALEHYQQAIHYDENNVYFNLDFANTYINLGAYDQAFEICQNLISKFPDFAVPYSYAGFIRLKQAKVGDAVRFFAMAVDKDWKNDMGSRALAATNLGILLGQQPDPKARAQAEAAYLIAIRSNPDFPEAYLNLAQLYVKTGHKDKAVGALESYKQRNPNYPAINSMLQQLGVK